MSAVDELEALYAELPHLPCKGLCSNTCGPIDMSVVERRRIADLGVDIPVATQRDHARWRAGERLDCVALTPVTRHPLMPNVRMASCTVYEARPMICRLWGMTESMRCEAGCKPERMLTDDECYDYLFRAYVIGEHPLWDHETVAKVREQGLNSDPELAPLFKRFLGGDRTVEGTIVRVLRERRRSA